MKKGKRSVGDRAGHQKNNVSGRKKAGAKR